MDGVSRSLSLFLSPFPNPSLSHPSLGISLSRSLVLTIVSCPSHLLSLLLALFALTHQVGRALGLRCRRTCHRTFPFAVVVAAVAAGQLALYVR